VPPPSGAETGRTAATSRASQAGDAHGVESRYAWWRLAAAVLLGAIGGVGLWSIVVVLPFLQAEFGVDRAGASLPYTITMFGFMAGGVLMGRLADRYGVVVPVVIGALALGAGYIGSAFAGGVLSFGIVYGLAVGMLGSSALFAPVVADTSLWFDRRRGVAVALASCGNYIAGTLWPPVLQPLIEAYGWRQTHIWVGVFCVATMLPLALVALRRPPPVTPPPARVPGGLAGAPDPTLRPLGLPPNLLQGILMVSGVACCVAMAMPQVHIVAYCVDLGYGAARGAEMLAIMLGTGVVSRLAAGFIMDRIGGMPTLLLFAALQAVALALYIPFDSLASLYVISAVFGLFQGGLVPSYAVIIRSLFPAREAGTRIGLVLSSTLAGMALGGWMTGAIFDATGSYATALVNGVAWNILTMGIALWLLHRSGRLGRGGGGARPAVA
jgi:MFS family permease